MRLATRAALGLIESSGAVSAGFTEFKAKSFDDWLGFMQRYGMGDPADGSRQGWRGSWIYTPHRKDFIMMSAYYPSDDQSWPADDAKDPLPGAETGHLTIQGSAEKVDEVLAALKKIGKGKGAFRLDLKA